MATFKFTGLGSGTARTDSASIGQIQDSLVGWVVSAGTVDAITATYSPAITTLVDGQTLSFRATGANTSATPTFAPSGLTARTIVRNGGTPLVAGDIPAALAECRVRYNLANTRWELLNPQPSFKVGNLTRAVTTASGNQAITGVGFKPKAIEFISGAAGTVQSSTGFDDGTTAGCIYTNKSGTADNFGTDTTYSIFMDEDGTKTYVGKIGSFDADGFTIAWTKNSTPTTAGTATITYKAQR